MDHYPLDKSPSLPKARLKNEKIKSLVGKNYDVFHRIILLIKGD